MMSIKRFAYQGQTYAIEWYHDEKGFSQAREFYEALPKERQLAAIMLFRRTGERAVKYSISQSLEMRVTKYLHLNHSQNAIFVFSLRAEKSLLLTDLKRKARSCPLAKRSGR